jgi:hypothetical protein
VETRYEIVPGFPRYRVGDDGSASSLKKDGTWRPLKPVRKTRGQLHVVFRRDGQSHDFLLGRLILTVFVGPCPEGMECLHENDDPSDNRLSKLRWGTHKENAADALRNRRYTQIGTAHHSAKLTPDDVKQILTLRASGMGIAELGRLFGVVHQHISKICRRKCWKEAV